MVKSFDKFFCDICFGFYDILHIFYDIFGNFYDMKTAFYDIHAIIEIPTHPKRGYPFTFLTL